jgi:hypothetical protein
MTKEWWGSPPQHQELIDELLKNVPESWDGDDSPDSIIVAYVRALEERVRQLGGTLERWWSFDQFRYDRRIGVRWLASTKQLQRDAYGDHDQPKTGDALANSVMMNSTGLTTELGEALAEVGWKPWAQPRGWVNRDAFIGELVDVGHFLGNLLVAVDCTDEEWETRYRAKQRLNTKRQEEGYDGVSTKCHVCKRALDDVGIEQRENPRRLGVFEFVCGGCGAVQDAEKLLGESIRP